MTRKKILEAAAQIFSQKGYHATSMNDIANAVNLQKASLYHHVVSKQEILLTLLDEALDLVIQEISDVIAMPISADKKLRLAMCTYLKTLAEQRDLSAILLLEHRSLTPDLHSRHLPRRDRFEHLWRKILQSGIDEGVFNIRDVPLTTRALLGLVNWVVTWYRSEGELSISEISEQYTDLILSGILNRNGENDL
jgi:AcrR family transcriptional regulator